MTAFELGVELLDARDGFVDELERGRLARADELGLRGCIDKRFRHVVLPLRLLVGLTRTPAGAGRPTVLPVRVGPPRG